MERSTQRIVFWDFDGTLARRAGMWSGALVDALATLGPHDLAAENFRPHLRDRFPWHRPDHIRGARGPSAWWNDLQPVFVDAYLAVGVDRERAEAAGRRVGQEYYRLDAWDLISGARAALERVRAAGYRSVILSNHGPELPELVSGLGLDDLVDRVISSALVGIEKPNPAIFRYALQLSHAGPDCWMIGDNPIADVAGAEAAGIRAVLADGVYPDSWGMTVMEAADQVCRIGPGC